MKNKFFLSLTCLFLSLISYSQNSAAGNTISGTKEKTLEQKMEGTYSIINKSKKVTELLTTEILMEIEKRRDDTREIYYEHSEYITIKILPRSVINASDFDPKKY
jgi:hypothetical protein